MKGQSGGEVWVAIVVFETAPMMGEERRDSTDMTCRCPSTMGGVRAILSCGMTIK